MISQLAQKTSETNTNAYKVLTLYRPIVMVFSDSEAFLKWYLLTKFLCRFLLGVSKSVDTISHLPFSVGHVKLPWSAEPSTSPHSLLSMRWKIVTSRSTAKHRIEPNKSTKTCQNCHERLLMSATHTSSVWSNEINLKLHKVQSKVRRLRVGNSNIVHLFSFYY